MRLLHKVGRVAERFMLVNVNYAGYYAIDDAAVSIAPGYVDAFAYNASDIRVIKHKRGAYLHRYILQLFFYI